MRARDFEDPGVRRLIVTGHPNHELAVLGFVQRVRPHLLFLTDGGTAERAAESRAVLELLGLSGRCRFLAVPEERLYRALLDGDRPTFAGLVEAVRREIEAAAPQQIICESVEFYNPLHDITLPVVRAAARGTPDVEILEFPLIAQIPGGEELYRVQRPSPGRESEAFSMRLTAEELAVKLQALAHRYPSLRRQMGGVLDRVEPSHAAVEYFLPARGGVPTPGPECVLRYEERGSALERQGRVERRITWRDHYLPAVSAMEAGARAQ